MLYTELLESSKNRFDEFFGNVVLFENQFKYESFNEECKLIMYKKNSYENLATVKNMKLEIEGLKDMCKKCGAYFIPARNKSIPKYDVILGKQMEEEFMKFLSRKLGVEVARGDTANRSYPDCVVKNKNGSIVAYFEFKYHAAPFVYAHRFIGRECYEGSATLDYGKMKKQLALIDEEIDTPVYYVHWIDYPCLKGIFYETSEQVKAYMNTQQAEFERKKRDGDDQKSFGAKYFSKIYSHLLKMKSFEELLEEFESLIRD